MLKYIKSLFIRKKVVKRKSDHIYSENQIILDDLERVIAIEGLADILLNDVVGTYQLEVHYPNILELLGGNSASRSPSLRAVNVRDYFKGQEREVYYIFRTLRSKLNSNVIVSRYENDLNELISMIDFYIEG